MLVLSCQNPDVRYSSLICCMGGSKLGTLSLMKQIGARAQPSKTPSIHASGIIISMEPSMPSMPNVIEDAIVLIGKFLH